MKLRWTERAVNDLLAIQAFIAEHNPQTAKQWVAKLRHRARNTTDAPLAGRVVPEFNQQDIREVFQGNYRIVYRVQENAILILTIFEGHRLLSL